MDFSHLFQQGSAILGGLLALLGGLKVLAHALKLSAAETALDKVDGWLESVAQFLGRSTPPTNPPSQG